MSTDIFISVAEEYEDRQRTKAGEATCIRDEMRILSAMHDVLKEFEAMYYNTMAREMGYGEPRFPSWEAWYNYYFGTGPLLPPNNEDFDGDCAPVMILS